METTKLTIKYINYVNLIIIMNTTIPITKKTKERLKKYGKMGETWDSLLNRILDECKKK